MFCAFLDELLDSEYFEEAEQKKEFGFDPKETAGKAELDMQEIQKEREAQGLPPD